MEFPESVILLDSLGDLQPTNSCPILVCGSHCGGNQNLARQVRSCRVQSVFLNNAGIGKNEAGIRGLKHYETEGVLACAVDCKSAEIGISNDTWESGVITHMNAHSAAAGIQIGETVKDAVAKLIRAEGKFAKHLKAENLESLPGNEKEEKVALKKQVQTQIDGIEITVTDSITFLNESNAGDIVVCGSHGGLSAGHYAQQHGVKAVFFNDAGIGKNNAGIRSLELLSKEGILACTVDCMTAEIFNGQDVLENGIVSACNQLAKSKGIKEKMTVIEAISFV